MKTHDDETPRGAVRSLPKPDHLPRSIRRIRELAPPFLSPNDGSSLERAIEEWEKLEEPEQSYTQTFLLAQLGLALGEVIAELRANTALQKEILTELRRSRKEITSGLDRLSFGDEEPEEVDPEPTSFGDAEAPAEPEAPPAREVVEAEVVEEPPPAPKARRPRKKKDEEGGA